MLLGQIWSFVSEIKRKILSVKIYQKGEEKNRISANIARGVE